MSRSLLFRGLSKKHRTSGGGGGSLTHGASATFTGSGFGSKSTAAPVVWDNCSHGQSIGTRWDGAWPSFGATTAAYMDYRSSQRSVSLPHNNITKYACGAHADTGGGGGGLNVMLWKARTLSGTFPEYTYISHYVRYDPAWTFGGTNLKIFDWSIGPGVGYDLPNNWYAEYKNPPTNATTSTGRYHFNDDTANFNAGPPITRTGSFIIERDGGSTNPIFTDTNGRWYGATGPTNPFANWIKRQYIIKHTDQTSGVIRIYEDGTLVHSYDDYTDKYVGTLTRAIGIEGYTDMPGSGNYRYLADIYLDYTWARIVLGDASTYAACTIIEPQPPTSWSSTSIDATVNKGRLSAGTVYPYVFAGGSETPIALSSRTMN